ncbi:MAG: ABC transporter ATP-binding protein [Gammaproteobacteria bacterium]|nr:ABC transporter ATP-binding protein [Gammaproteobacteria bacterium]
MSDVLLRAEKIGKVFGGLKALHDVSLTIPRNCIYGLIGPNGAGKTTLFNVITGLYKADGGTLELNGKSLIGCKPHTIVRCGVARTFQNIRLFGHMTAQENVMVARHTHLKAGVFGAIFRPPAVRREEAACRAEALRLLQYVGIGSQANRVARELSYGDQRRLEIARALATEPQLLALDEPAAGMNPTERETLKNLLLQIRNDGTTLLLIEHDVKLVLGICDQLSVLNFGQCIAQGTPEQVRRDPAVISAYLGSSAA